MFTQYSLERTFNKTKVMLHVDAKHKEAGILTSHDRVLQDKTWKNPGWHQIGTPEQAVRWMGQLDLPKIDAQCRQRAAEPDLTEKVPEPTWKDFIR